MICAAAPPSGGRSPLTPRFMRHFHVFCMPNPTDDTLKVIFEGIINGFLTKNSFSDAVKKAGSFSVGSTVDLFSQITLGLLPTPAKFHYTFNLRDISKVFQGILMSKPVSIANNDSFAKLWLHEASRVFHDRLINKSDRDFYKDLAFELLKAKFKVNCDKEEIFETNPIFFGILLRLEADEKYYEEIQDKAKLIKVLES